MKFLAFPFLRLYRRFFGFNYFCYSVCSSFPFWSFNVSLCNEVLPLLINAVFQKKILVMFMSWMYFDHAFNAQTEPKAGWNLENLEIILYTAHWPPSFSPHINNHTLTNTRRDHFRLQFIRSCLKKKKKSTILLNLWCSQCSAKILGSIVLLFLAF